MRRSLAEDVGPGHEVCDIHTVGTITSQEQLGARIRDARLAHGLSQETLAGKLGMDRSALARVEGGDRRVTALELFAVGEVLGLPLSFFVHESPAAMTSRRAVLDEDAQRFDRERFRLDAFLESHLRDAEDLRTWGFIEPVASAPRGSDASAEAVRELAADARRAMDVPSGPLPPLAEAAEAVGLHLLVVDMDVDGASLTPAIGFGVAVIGGRPAPGRRRFTAAHEIGHHLLGDEYQSDVGVATSRSERERLIDAFATELLLPTDDVIRSWATFPGDARAKLLRLAADYRVSWSVAVRAAREAQVLPAEDASRLRHATPQLGDFVAVLGRSPAEDLVTGTTGPAWRRAVLAAYTQGRITRPRAVEMLHGALTEAELPAVAEPAP